MTAKNKLMTIGLLLLAIVGLGGLISPPPSSAQEMGLENLRQTGQAFRSVAKKVSPAVVLIKVEKEETAQNPQLFSPFNGPLGGDDFFRHFFGEPPQQFQNPHHKQEKRYSMGQGSGIIVSPDGFILTNNHVVGGADKVEVQMEDGRQYTAKIIGTDPPSDLAVIKIDAKNLPYLTLGDSDKLEVGDWVLAVGNPFGLSHTLTAGIVSAKGRSGIGLNDYENFIQTDAAINPGNSGGPLVNLDGQVVGINTAIFSRSGGYMGIGFAIPANMAKQVLKQLIENGHVTRGRLGVYIQDLTEDLAKSFGLKNTQGVLISDVIKGSPAAEAGLKRGDIVQELNGKKIDKMVNFRNEVAMTAPGTKVTLTILRNGKTEDVPVTIGKMETGKEENTTQEGNVNKLGLTLQALTPDLADQLGYTGEQGVLVTSVDPGSLAADAGIQRGDLIQEINRHPVKSPSEARDELQKTDHGNILILLRHGQATRYLVLTPGE